MTFTFVFTYFLVTLICSAIAVIILVQLDNDMGSEQEVRAFRNYIAWYLAFALSNAVWIWINYNFLDISGWPFSMVNLVAILLTSYYWFKYVELRLDSKRVATATFRVISAIPLAAAMALVVTSPLTKLVFDYTADNVYVHGPLYSTMAILAILYLLVASIDIALHLSQVQSPSQVRQFRMLILFLVFPVIGGIIDIFVPNLPIMELMLLFSTILVYTSMQKSQIYNDVLTGLNNRRLADEYLIEQIALASPEAPLYFFICDINRFKEINDTHGHTEGDRALRLVAEALKEATADIHCHIARWGGDEFVIIASSTEVGSPTALMGKVRRSVEGCTEGLNLGYNLSLSIGFTECTDPGVSATEILRQADQEMYTAKRESHNTAAN